MKFRDLEMDPSCNPGVLDTATWDRAAAWQAVCREGDRWSRLAHGSTAPAGPDAHVFAGSLVRQEGAAFALVRLADQQQVFVRVGQGGEVRALGEPLGRATLADGTPLTAYPTDAAVIDAFCHTVAPAFAPGAPGPLPRLGIGTRMTTLVWPGIFDAMDRRGFAAVTIQNSVRELNLLDDILNARPAPRNYACGFGAIDTGYTGSTFEGLWVSGVLAALQHGRPLRFGADADHIQVKRGADGLDRSKRVIEAARYYTFYTLDMADVLDYAALDRDSGPSGSESLERKIDETALRNDVLTYHRAPLALGGKTYRFDDDCIGRYVGKYWDALSAAAELTGFIAGLKQGRPFDLEFAIDEHPPEVAAFDCLSTEEEMIFVCRELKRRGLPVTHVAPNLGMEKGHDYRGQDGLDGLEARTRGLFEIAEHFGVMIDVHSADDLTSPTRRALRRATGGRYHYKISPILQIIFARVLEQHAPALFRRWWEDAVAYARREAAAGSSFARECLVADETTAGAPSSRHQTFHHYSFAFVGRRDEQGRFANRGEFYSLPPECRNACAEAVCDHLCELADDLF